jgi:hypothetical protein
MRAWLVIAATLLSATITHAQQPQFPTSHSYPAPRPPPVYHCDDGTLFPCDVCSGGSTARDCHAAKKLRIEEGRRANPMERKSGKTFPGDELSPTTEPK